MVAKLAVYISMLLSAGCIAGDIKNKTELQLFQDYALSACIAHAYHDGDIYDDSISALNGYRARSRVPLEAYSEINNVIVKWLAKPYKSKTGNTIEIATCIDQVKSDDIKSIFNNFNPCNEENFWRDKKAFKVRCSKYQS
jgi:hypothetical protein